MNSVSLISALIQNFLIVGLILNAYHFLTSTWNWRFVLFDLLGALFLSILGIFVEDANLILLLLMMYLFESFRQRTFNVEVQNLAYFTIAILLESFIFILANCIVQLIDYIFKLALTSESILNGTYIFVAIGNLILLSLIVRFKRQIQQASNKIRDFNLELKIFQILLVFFFSLELILIISNLQHVSFSIQGTILFCFTIFTVLIVIQLITFIKDYTIREDTQLRLENDHQLKSYLANMEQQYLKLRQFKHDYNNLLLSLDIFARNSDSTQFKAYYKELMQQQPLKETLQKNFIPILDRIQNDALRGVIIQKLVAAKKIHAQLNIEVTEDFHIKTDNIIPIVRIVGILLDNALENSTQQNPLIDCALIKTPGTAEIIVKNETQKPLNISECFKTGVSTKSGHSGFGLSNIEHLVAENPNLFLDASFKDGFFQVSIIILEES